MADDGAKSAAGTEVPDVSPGAGFQVFVEMANLYNKLKLLNYDDEYVIKWRMKPISRIHFAVAGNPGDQLHAFIALAAWLFQKGGVRFDKPSEVCIETLLLFNILFVLK
jgi:estrogen-related receptor beta like 1